MVVQAPHGVSIIATVFVEALFRDFKAKQAVSV